MAQRVVVMYAGKVMEEADVETLFANPKHPYTVGLLNSIPKLGRKQKRRRLQTIAGGVPSLFRLPEGCLFSERCSDVFDECRRIAPEIIDLGGRRKVRCLKYVE